MTKPDESQQTLGDEDTPQYYVIEHNIVVRWMPGLGPQKDTVEGWKPYKELVKFAHEAMPISEAEAWAIRESLRNHEQAER